MDEKKKIALSFYERYLKKYNLKGLTAYVMTDGIRTKFVQSNHEIKAPAKVIFRIKKYNDEIRCNFWSRFDS